MPDLPSFPAVLVLTTTLLLSGCPEARRSAPTPAASPSPPMSSSPTPEEEKLDRLIEEALDKEQGK